MDAAHHRVAEQDEGPHAARAVAEALRSGEVTRGGAVQQRQRVAAGGQVRDPAQVGDDQGALGRGEEQSVAAEFDEEVVALCRRAIDRLAGDGVIAPGHDRETLVAEFRALTEGLSFRPRCGRRPRPPTRSAP
ncbi:hypothetical protein [Streptomyces mayteni]